MCVPYQPIAHFCTERLLDTQPVRYGLSSGSKYTIPSGADTDIKSPPGQFRHSGGCEYETIPRPHRSTAVSVNMDFRPPKHLALQFVLVDLPLSLTLARIIERIQTREHAIWTVIGNIQGLVNPLPGAPALSHVSPAFVLL